MIDYRPKRRGKPPAPRAHRVNHVNQFAWISHIGFNRTPRTRIPPIGWERAPIRTRDNVGMSATPATKQLDTVGVAYLLHRYSVHIDDPIDSTYGEAVAAEVGADPDSVFKTLIAAVEGELIAAVVPVSARLNLKSLATAVGAKRAELGEPAAAERATGYVVGGISPLGQRTRLRVVADETIVAFDTVYVSAGKRGLQLSLDPADLIQVVGALVAPISDL